MRPTQHATVGKIMTYAEEEELRATHKWIADRHRPYNAAACTCGFACSRSAGGGGWGPGEWQYFFLGQSVTLTPCDLETNA